MAPVPTTPTVDSLMLKPTRPLREKLPSRVRTYALWMRLRTEGAVRRDVHGAAREGVLKRVWQQRRETEAA